MIEYKTGDILKEEAEALVNTVNCVGVMGRGIALQFKRALSRQLQSLCCPMQAQCHTTGARVRLRDPPTHQSPLHHQLPDQAALAGQ